MFNQSWNSKLRGRQIEPLWEERGQDMHPNFWLVFLALVYSEGINWDFRSTAEHST
jgi:hypothetical protein